MKYYSEITKKVYDTEDELKKAELAVENKKSAREKEAKEVEKLCKEAAAASDKAKKALADFNKKYGTFHTSVNATDGNSLFDLFFNDLFW